MPFICQSLQHKSRLCCFLYFNIFIFNAKRSVEDLQASQIMCSVDMFLTRHTSSEPSEVLNVNHITLRSHLGWLQPGATLIKNDVSG